MCAKILGAYSASDHVGQCVANHSCPQARKQQQQLAASAPKSAPLYLDLEFQLPALDFAVIKQDAGAAAEVLVAIHSLVAAPAEEGTAAAAGHLVAALGALDCHPASWALLCCLLRDEATLISYHFATESVYYCPSAARHQNNVADI